MILGIQQFSFGKFLAERTVNALVFAEAQTSFMEQSFGDVEHCIIGASRRKLRVLSVEQSPRCADGALRLFEKLSGFLFQAAMASSRTLMRNGLSRCRQSSKDTKTRLTLSS